jgi:hypothetical protein
LIFILANIIETLYEITIHSFRHYRGGWKSGQFFSVVYKLKTPSSEHQYFDVQKKGWGAACGYAPDDSLPT